MKETYLGDGVYATFNGFAIVLDLRAQDSTTRITLEPSILAALNEFDKASRAEAVAVAVAEREEEAARHSEEEPSDTDPKTGAQYGDLL